MRSIDDILDWIAKCEDADQLRNLMVNAEKKGQTQIYWKAFERLCALEGMEFSDPLDRDFYVTLAAYEELLTIKNRRTTRASRTRQKLKNKGVIQTLEDWALSSQPTEGFDLLIKNNLARLTGEYLVVKYEDRFSPQTVAAAKARLTKAGVLVASAGD